MKYREVTIFTGAKFRVPEHIQRLDSKHTHGWQLRFGKWTMFSDHSNDGTGARTSLTAAKEELLKRIDKLHAPTGLRTTTLSSKTTDLPVGISGPVRSVKRGRRVAEFNFVISVPQAGGRSTSRKAYIGTENTISDERIMEALAVAVDIRKQAVRVFQDTKTRTKRALSRKHEKT